MRRDHVPIIDSPLSASTTSTASPRFHVPYRASGLVVTRKVNPPEPEAARSLRSRAMTCVRLSPFGSSVGTVSASSGKDTIAARLPPVSLVTTSTSPGCTFSFEEISTTFSGREMSAPSSGCGTRGLVNGL